MEKEVMEKVLSYVETQRDYCKKQANVPKYQTAKYSINGTMTDEQMSGYYQGRSEANMAIIARIEEESDK